MGARINIPKNVLQKLYVDDGMTLKSIAQMYNCSRATISEYRKLYNIPLRKDKPWTSELNRITKKKYNVYDLSGDFGIGYTSNTNEEFYFDLCDYDKIKDVCWSVNSGGYVCGRYIDGKSIKLHQLVMGCKHIDHINHNTFDNRKQNLRKSDDLLNSRNRSTSKNSKSGCRGVCWRSREGKWRAYITHLGKRIELGLYSNLDDAISARKSAENELYGEWSYYNSINNGGN